MKLFSYLKLTFKNILATLATNLAIFIVVPLALGCFLGFLKDQSGTNPISVKTLDISIKDEDNTDMSRTLVEFLKDDSLKDLINITEDGDADIVIPTGYGENVLNGNEGEIVLEKREKGHMVLTTLKSILDKYHKGLYIALKGGNTENLETILKEQVIDTTLIDYKEEMSGFETSAINLTQFMLSMLILTFIQSSYHDISINFEKRLNSVPLTRRELLIYDYISSFAYSFLFIGIYTAFYRISGIAFKGSIISLIAIDLIAALLVASISKIVTTFINKKYGQIVGLVIYILPFIGLKMFGEGEGNIIANFAPTEYIARIFQSYGLEGNIQAVSSDALIILAISLVLFLLCFIKESMIKGEKRWA